MNILQVAKKYNLSFLSNTFEQKEYSYTCVLDNALTMQKDFIYLPFCKNKSTFFSLIEKALNNPCCKGFIINRSWLENLELRNEFDSLMSKYSTRIEVAALASNIYNLAYKIGRAHV